MEIENLDLEKVKEVIVNWAREKPFITKIYLFGSRVAGFSKKTREAVRPDSDLDIAIEFDRISAEEDYLTTWTAEKKIWRKELLTLLGISKENHLSLNRYHPEETPEIHRYLKEGSTLIYSSSAIK